MRWFTVLFDRLFFVYYIYIKQNAYIKETIKRTGKYLVNMYVELNVSRAVCALFFLSSVTRAHSLEQTGFKRIARSSLKLIISKVALYYGPAIYNKISFISLIYGR